MAELVYLLCLVTSGCAAALLIRSYVRTKTRLLLWSSICFVGLALNNALLFVDLVIWPAVDLSVPRSALALVSISLLAFALIREQP